MSTRNNGGVKVAGETKSLNQIHVPIALKCGSLNLLETSGPLEAYTGVAVPAASSNLKLANVQKNILEKNTMKDKILWNVENLLHCNYYAAVQFLDSLYSVWSIDRADYYRMRRKLSSAVLRQQ
jgi:hypothetical protein